MTEQLTFWSAPTPPPPTERFRSIHYLGSKLRLLGVIDEVLSAVDPTSGPLCDLFAGSGVVGRSQASHRDVVAVDIQEYSRVLNAALLRGADVDEQALDSVFRGARTSELRDTLYDAFAPLLDFEQRALDNALHGDGVSLANIVEFGSVRASVGDAKPLCDLPTRETQARLCQLNLYDDPRAAIASTYGGVYFSYRQAVELDVLLAGCHELEGVEQDVALAAVLSTASELVTSVGSHFAQPIRVRDATGDPKPSTIHRLERQRRVDALEEAEKWVNRYASLPALEGNHQAVRADYREFLTRFDGAVGVVYADPPYTRDHYSRFYHVLETMALRDTPRLETRIRNGRAISRGLYRQERHQSPFCIKTQAPQAFVDLFAGARQLEVPLCLSYSPYDASSGARPRLMTVEHIVSLARQWFGGVSVEEVSDVSHSKLNSARVNMPRPANAEILIVCVP